MDKYFEGRTEHMKIPKKLRDLLAMEDSKSKKSQLWLFGCKVLPHCYLWELANDEINRLQGLGY
jgi:hypothetical protein